VTNVLLITDVPRLRKVFSRLVDDMNIRLRVANSLERGGEEIVADKPAVIFVQTHLSGLSADILFKHLKKQLGRKRSRFVLLSPPEQTSDELLKLYQGHLDTSLDDISLSAAIREMITGTGAKETPPPSSPLQQTANAAESALEPHADDGGTGQHSVSSPLTDAPIPLALPQIPEGGDPSLEEQGVTYAPRPRVSVYSEFTNSFDSAVSDMQPAEPVVDSPTSHTHSWDHEEIETIDSEPRRSKRATFLFWFAPVLIAVIIITILQHRRSQSTTKVDLTPAKPVPSTLPANQATVVTPATPAVKAPVAPAPSNAQKPAEQPLATGTNTQSSDRAVMSAIAENRGPKAAPSGTRLTGLPDFIPRTGLDKSYGAANPGWERYKGHSTEFKIYREGATIKALQVIDRGGKGVPESFMKAVLRQVTKRPAFVLAGTEKKDGYEIQRGQVADNLKAVYYRDEQGGTIRAFVLTWQ
jgi:CheY-like chemotaxis protein